MLSYWNCYIGFDTKLRDNELCNLTLNYVKTQKNYTTKFKTKAVELYYQYLDVTLNFRGYRYTLTGIFLVELSSQGFMFIKI